MSDNSSLAAHDQSALIARLAADLRPVSRLASPWRRAGLWALAALWIGLLLSFFTNWPAFWAREMAAPDMWISQAAALLTALLAGIAALQTAVPGRPAAWALLPMPSLLVWIGASTAGCLRLAPITGTQPEPAMHVMVCAQFIVLVSVPLSALLVWLLMLACPLRPGLTASLGGLASAAAAATLLALIHPFDASSADLLLHGVAVGLVVILTRVVGGRALRPSFSGEKEAKRLLSGCRGPTG